MLIQKQKIIIDLILLFSLLVFPNLVSFFSVLGIIDEIVFLFMAFIIIYRIFKYHVNILFSVALIGFISYSVFLIFRNNLPIRNIMQIFIYIKFLIVFIYFYTNYNAYKVSLFKTLYSILHRLSIVSIYFVILQLLFPSLMNGNVIGRGINGSTVSGVFFGSRIIYSEFILLLIILIMAIKGNYSLFIFRINKYKYYIVIGCYFLLILTFSRKEILLGLCLLPILFKDKVQKDSKFMFNIFLFIIIMSIIIIGIYILSDLNTATFSEKQIRYIIYLHVIDIFNFYAPFGSGPGTFGSIMSLDYMNVYEQFGVGNNVLGWGDERGPIFDLFLISLFAEYGLGILFFFYFIFKIKSAKNNLMLNNTVNIKMVKTSLTVIIIAISLFVPIFMNWIGYIYFTVLALLLNQESTYGKKKQL